MSGTFQKILIPVDFSINTEVSVRKAMELADDENGELHLLHVLSCRKRFPGSSAIDSSENKDTAGGHTRHQELMDQLKQMIGQEKPMLRVHQYIIDALSISLTIGKIANRLNVDLIIISKNKTHRFFPFLNTVRPCKLAITTGKTILTLKPGALHQSIKTIVVPVTGSSPYNKMQAIALLHAKYRFKVHLVSFLNNKDKTDNFSSASLVQSFRWIKENIRCPVEFTVLHGRNRAKTLLRYAENTGADMMLVDPFEETKTGWLDQQIPDVIPAASKIQLLLFSPELNTIKITQ